VSSKFHFVAVCVAFLGAGGVASLPGSSVADTQSAFRKLGAIERGGVKPGTRLNFTKPEIDGWIQDEAKSHVPQGLDHVRLDLSDGRVTGYANIDFLKVRQASGGDPGWLMKNLFAGERPVTVVARVSSAGGRARVDVERVEISGVPIQGAALDFVIANYVRPTFPDVKVDEWFALQYGVERIAVAGTGVTVVMGRRK
jgi:hypothetical protein